jgi:hypothetical protein
MDDCLRFELPGSPDTGRMRQTPDDQMQFRLPSDCHKAPMIRRIGKNYAMTDTH